ncbi:MAG: iron-containing redox enzyme family protein [Acidimicrobiales bacterium]
MNQGTAPLAAALSTAVDAGAPALDRLAGAAPVSRHDRAHTLLVLYDLHTAPVAQLGRSAELQWHPVVNEIKTRLERQWMDELDAAPAPPGEAIAIMRTVAARDRVPPVYRWLADYATWEEVVHFLTLEGGPDAGFDDLVATCQIGLAGRPKLELATNYWDEMGRGQLEGVHTVLHDRMVEALAMPRLDRREQSAEALERVALGALLATNRWLQPEMLGALGLIEIQAGPRCRMVLRAFDRVGAPEDAYPFYRVHAEVDPIHGRAWLENAILPTISEQPSWAPRIVRGAWWRSQVNAAFFQSMSPEDVQPVAKILVGAASERLSR